jgi:hypothetical protein
MSQPLSRGATERKDRKITSMDEKCNVYAFKTARRATEELHRTSATSECLLHFMQGENIKTMIIADPTVVEIMKSFA